MKKEKKFVEMIIFMVMACKEMCARVCVCDWLAFIILRNLNHLFGVSIGVCGTFA